jgi:hypothetical protein
MASRITGAFGFTMTTIAGTVTEDSDGWVHTPWGVVLVGPNGGVYTTTYRMGLGHKGKSPEVGEVLESLALDATEEAFDDWCGEYGLSIDSRKSHDMWTECRKVHDWLSSQVDDLNALREAVQEA